MLVNGRRTDWPAISHYLRHRYAFERDARRPPGQIDEPVIEIRERQPACESRAERCGVAQISRDSLNRKAVEIPQIRIRSRQYTNVDTDSREGSRHRGSDEPGRACDQRFHQKC